MLGSIRDVLSKRLPIEYSRPVIFANLSRSRNLRNKGRTKISGFTVSRSEEREKKKCAQCKDGSPVNSHVVGCAGQGL